MSNKPPKNSDPDWNLTFIAGFITGRMAMIDESEGYEEIAPGRLGRIRAARVILYCTGRPGTVDILLEGDEEPYTMCGTIEQVDKAMRLDRLQTFGKGDENV